MSQLPVGSDIKFSLDLKRQNLRVIPIEQFYNNGMQDSEKLKGWIGNPMHYDRAVRVFNS